MFKLRFVAALLLSLGWIACGDDKPSSTDNASTNNASTNNASTNNTSTNNTSTNNNTTPLPDSAFSRELPDGATEISAEALQEGIANGTLFQVSIGSLRAERLEREAQEEEDDQSIARYVAQFPDVEFDPSILNTLKEPEDDGNFTFVWRTDDDIEKSVSLLGQHWAKRTVAESLVKFPTLENQFNIYEHLFAELPFDIVSALELPSPEDRLIDPTLFTVEKVSGYVTSITELGASIVLGQWEMPSRPGEKPLRCEDEIGSGSAGDRFDSDDLPDPQGLFALFEWKQKWNHTCIKNQFVRGTCVAMSTISAIEHMVARKHKRWVNLSEQWLYNQMLFEWDRHDYGDGFWAYMLAQKLQEEVTPIPYEEVWNYNPSPQRRTGEQICFAERCGGSACAACEDDPVNHFYVNSCTDYTEICGDATHQSAMKCSGSIELSQWRCGFEAIPEMNPERLGYSSDNYSSLFDYSNRRMSFERLLINLAFGSPIVVGLPLYTSFWQATGNRGFMPMPSGAPDRVEGWHAMHILTYVDNSKLPVVDPPFPQGAGGGWFIVKNSWGTSFGDAGYVYIPYDFVKDYTNDIVAFHSLHP